MPGAIRAVPGTNNMMYATFQATNLDEPIGDLANIQYSYNWLTANVVFKSSWTHNHPAAYWPSSGRMGFFSDPAAPACGVAGLDEGSFQSGDFEPWSRARYGSQSQKYIIGYCKRSTGEALGGAVVKGFRTSDGLYIGSTTTDNNGRYELKCPNTGTDQHYLVAYYDSETDLAGSTVNTLVPTWRDGAV